MNTHERAHAYLKRIGGMYLDNSHYIISANRAGRMCKPYGVPRHGYERTIEHDGIRYIVARTITSCMGNGREQVWTVRPAR